MTVLERTTVAKKKRNQRKRHRNGLVALILVVVVVLSWAGATGRIEMPSLVSDYLQSLQTTSFDVPADDQTAPAYTGEMVTDGGSPTFSDEMYENAVAGFEVYGDLDSLGRVTGCSATITDTTLEAGDEERGNISSVKPTGWVQGDYDFVDGGKLYNRCHLIAHNLTGQNANDKNLLTGTRSMNLAMIPYENAVADYVEDTDDEVLYRVVPVFEGDDLVCQGVWMEASSVADRGASLSFRVFVHNVEPGVVIDYATGENHAE